MTISIKSYPHHTTIFKIASRKNVPIVAQEEGGEEEVTLVLCVDRSQEMMKDLELEKPEKPDAHHHHHHHHHPNGALVAVDSDDDGGIETTWRLICQDIKFP